MSLTREQLAQQIVDAGRFLYGRGWSPATSSNYSTRLSPSEALLTVSGKHKGQLGLDDVLATDLSGNSLEPGKKPSAETLLHTQLYRRFPEVGCVLHTHSPVQTIASRLYAPQGHIRVEGYELLKAFAGNSTHEMAIDIPVFANTQDMNVLSAQVDDLLDRQPLWGYLIDGHGLYAWGRDMAEARRHMEAFEFLLHCELELRKLRG